MRFIHFSLFGGTFLSLHYYLVDGVFCMAFVLLGFRAAAGLANGHAISLAQRGGRPDALAPQTALT